MPKDLQTKLLASSSETDPNTSLPAPTAPAKLLERTVLIGLAKPLVHPIRPVMRLPIDELIVGKPPIPLKESDIDALMNSIQKVGQKIPVTVNKIANGDHVLVEGWGRVAALRLLGGQTISATVYYGLSDEQIRIIQITSNHHKALSKLDRAQDHYEFLQLTRAKVAQLAAPVGGKQPAEKGYAKTAQFFATSADQVTRSEKIAKIHSDVKDVIRALKMENNQAAMLKIADAGDTPELQIACARELKLAKSKPRISKGKYGAKVPTLNAAGLANDVMSDFAHPETGGIVEPSKSSPSGLSEEIPASDEMTPDDANEAAADWADEDMHTSRLNGGFYHVRDEWNSLRENIRRLKESDQRRFVTESLKPFLTEIQGQ